MGRTCSGAEPVCPGSPLATALVAAGSRVLCFRVHRHFLRAISSFAAIEYSDSTLVEAKHLLLGLASFVEDARAYVKGQLTCGPGEEDVLWER